MGFENGAINSLKTWLIIGPCPVEKENLSYYRAQARSSRKRLWEPLAGGWWGRAWGRYLQPGQCCPDPGDASSSHCPAPSRPDPALSTWSPFLLTDLIRTQAWGSDP